MGKRIATRGNTVFLNFFFYDENGDEVNVESAEVRLTYPGSSDFASETIALTEDDNTWSGEWDSSNARPGWVEYHAHATAPDVAYSQDGRFRLTGNRANMDHDDLPTGTELSADYGLVP